jgi:hypothetical protein
MWEEARGSIVKYFDNVVNYMSVRNRPRSAPWAVCLGALLAFGTVVMRPRYSSGLRYLAIKTLPLIVGSIVVHASSEQIVKARSQVDPLAPSIAARSSDRYQLT